MEMDSKVVLIETAKSTASILYFKNHLFEIRETPNNGGISVGLATTA